MPVWQIVLVVFLAVVLVAGLGYLIADRRGWIKNERLRRLLRKVYGIDQDNDRN